MKIKLQIPRVGFILLALSLIFTIIGYCYYQYTFEVFNYQPSKLIIAMTIISVWSTISLLVNSLFFSDKHSFFDVFYLINVVAVILSFAYLLMPCLSPIGVYFTVNMGDMETYSKGVPSCITGCVFYVLSAIITIVASFFVPTKGKEA